MTVGNATRLGASQRSTRDAARRTTSLRNARTAGDTRRLCAFSADGHPQAPVAPRRLCAARTFFVARSWAECITPICPELFMTGTGPLPRHHYSIIGRPIQSLLSQRTAKSGCLSPCKRARAS